MKKRKLVPFLAITLVASLGVTACSFGGGAKDDKDTLVIASRSEPKELDTAKTTDGPSGIVTANVQEGLYRHAKDGKSVEPALVDGEPQVSADKLTYTFKIRDAKWSDGKPVRAQDFEFAWKRTLTPETAAEYAMILWDLKNGRAFNEKKTAKVEDVGVKALDDKTLEVKLEKPLPYLKNLLAFPMYLPQREDIVKQYGKDFAKNAKANVYNGPYKLVDWKQKQSLTLEKNENYWDAATVKTKKIEIKVMTDASAAINAYTTGQVQVANVGGDFIQKYKDDKEAVAIKEPTSAMMIMNQKNKFLANTKVRQALQLAFDSKEYQQGVLQDKSTAAGGLVPGNVKGNGKDLEKLFRESAPAEPKFDVTEAKRLLAEGLKELGMDKAPELELIGDDTTSAKRHGEYVKDSFKKNLGVDVKISSLPFQQRRDRTTNGQFDLVAFLWQGDYNDAMSYLDLFVTGGPFNYAKWSNKEYDALIKKAQENKSGDSQERLDAMIQAEKILLDEAVIIPEYYRTMTYLVKPTVKDMVFSSEGFGEELSFKWVQKK
ncbi:oligopeptide transport system substrate-binding protein [Thermoactinomyces sp. DSM 45891]|uniref:peptide ABC transporter substrate-binding protein n=1 Tax=Thermoactinomyces sp. DSM 45891 TaxID=1761907 RepID=UPI0009113A08|nr:peptide ABC transporter substrate-binding protein [Thermoactinomyces sp. DSM 45891]SFX21086.1 oligopeptide transport system substrate-binding protein [Thermoactinomyces sp. DSM 45891]